MHSWNGIWGGGGGGTRPPPQAHQGPVQEDLLAPETNCKMASPCHCQGRRGRKPCPSANPSLLLRCHESHQPRQIGQELLRSRVLPLGSEPRHHPGNEQQEPGPGGAHEPPLRHERLLFQGTKVSQVEILQHVIDYIFDLQIVLEEQAKKGQDPSAAETSLLSLKAAELASELCSKEERNLCH
uniref:BHLH domain-containing protein n=1 Tax=Podarcis muralis TaxID=64176 RepID=A0A670IMG9_PODMU